MSAARQFRAPRRRRALELMICNALRMFPRNAVLALFMILNTAVVHQPTFMSEQEQRICPCSAAMRHFCET
jgi:hypothetical protein